MNALEKRIAGILPEIDIAGHTYTIDIKLQELRNKKEPWKNLKFDQMVMSENGENYLFFFRSRRQELFYASQEMIHVPKDVVMVEIPHELHLDPVGMARKYGMADDYFQKGYPMQEKRIANITPLEKTGLLEHVAQNRRQQKTQNAKGQKL
ncbi:hypothetical protein KZP23_04750 [Echinicola marina]|uniref:hypothetical protein n=1 Tax=Echinicola marina TaxID=2859768 RepID=UPI001CF6BC07|nr:hypothetical protein [Echinicola marina]UCS94342.1 hypothetical protein KZP23_04750 [Echinicola marina]